MFLLLVSLVIPPVAWEHPPAAIVPAKQGVSMLTYADVYRDVKAGHVVSIAIRMPDQPGFITLSDPDAARLPAGYYRCGLESGVPLMRRVEPVTTPVVVTSTVAPLFPTCVGST